MTEAVPFEELPFEEWPFEELPFAELGIEELESRLRLAADNGPGDPDPTINVVDVTVAW